jgi:hypothetical protein
MNKQVTIPKWWFALGFRRNTAIDHIIAVKDKFYNRIEVHSRPYHILQCQLKEIIKVCDEKGICFKIDGKTNYINQDTCLLRFWRLEDDF